MYKKIIIGLLLLCFIQRGFAQDTLSGNYGSLTLAKKTYYVNDVVAISDEFVAEAGATIRIGNGASIICLGSVRFSGTPTDRIRVTSTKGQTGNGLVIQDSKNSEISFQFTTFDSLSLPILLSDSWFRTRAFMRNCQFINNVGSQAVVQVMNPQIPFSDNPPKSSIEITQCLFAGNNAPLRFEDLRSDYLRITVSGNTFSGNKISGYAQYTYSNNVLFGKMDLVQTNYSANISGNSFSFNYMRELDADTIVQQAHMGIYGNGDSLLVPNNYWGDYEEAEIRKHIFDYKSNYTSPKLSIQPFLQAPSDTVPPHIFGVINAGGGRMLNKQAMKFINDRWQLVGDSSNPVTNGFNLRQGLRAVQLISNRPVVARNMSVHFVYAKDSLSTADSVISPGAYKKDIATKNTLQLNFTLPVDTLFKSKPGYIIVRGLEGEQGEFVPDVYIGYETFLKFMFSRRVQLGIGRGGGKGTGMEMDSAFRKKAKPPVIVSEYKKKYEIGIVAGNAIYYGTLSNSNLFANDFNSAFGLQLRYSLKKNLSISVSYLMATLTGSDLRSGDTAKFSRGMSFRTKTSTVSVMFEYDFFNNRVYSSNQRFRPSIGFGFDYIMFTPEGQYLGEWYPLQPIGTGGQTIAPPGGTAPGPYATSTLGAPIGAQLRYYINKKTIFSFFATYHLAFTNYLDDVGPDPYPDRIAIGAANPDNPARAQYFANPTNRLVKPGQLRSGAADVSDGFFTFGFTLAHHF
jgi:hypothetical protein